MKTLIFLVLITAASAGDNVLLIIADDYGVDVQTLNNSSSSIAPAPNVIVVSE